jgi:hypothetical protein
MYHPSLVLHVGVLPDAMLVVHLACLMRPIALEVRVELHMWW